MKAPYMEVSMTSGGIRRGSARNPARNFGLTLIVMGASFILYYLGLFGTQEGPLNPAGMGTALHEWGVRRHHVIVLMACLSALALVWNWVFNLTAWMLGHRITCKAPAGKEGAPCGQRAIRRQSISKHTGRAVTEYICRNGHRRPEAHFQPVRKGVIANTIWIGCLILTLITLASV